MNCIVSFNIDDILEFVDPARLIEQIKVNARVAFHMAFAKA